MRAIVLLIVVGAVLPLAACASAAAKAPPDRPTLEVPAPPTRVVEPSPRPEPTPEPVPELPPQAPPNARTAKPPVREPARTDPKPEATPTTETTAAPVVPVTPAPQLRPGNTPDASEAAKQAQIAVDSATKALNSINLRLLSKERRPVYDDAKRVLASAVDALKKSDFDNAKKLAEKVESTARELGAR